MSHEIASAGKVERPAVVLTLDEDAARQVERFISEAEDHSVFLSPTMEVIARAVRGFLKQF